MKYLTLEGLQRYNELLEEKFGGGVVPVGTIINFAGNDLPNGFLLCDGSELSREVYSALFDAIGTTYGEGDGESTFALPDADGRYAQWSDTAGTIVDAGAPDIQGSLTSVAGYWGGYPDCSGAFSQSARRTSLTGSDAIVGLKDFDFNASSSNSIYGSADTVQPPAITVLPAIKYI